MSTSPFAKSAPALTSPESSNDLPSENLFGSGFLNGRSSGTDITSQHLSNLTIENKQHADDEPHLNPRSCVTCRKRKVRCDKHEPCGNCRKAGIDCIFPAPGRAPRKPRRPPDAELLKRLRRLEGVVQSLGAHVDEHDAPVSQVTLTEAPPILQSDLQNPSGQGGPPSTELGKLVVSEGKSRYINNAYWNTIGNEIADMRDVLDQSSSDEEWDHNDTPLTNREEDHSGTQAFLFSFSSAAVDMKRLHPSPTQIFIIWDTFKENVDPVVKILHCPSVRNLILKAAVNTDTLSRPAEAVFFSICLASVVSMSEEQCQSHLGDTKSVLWKKYRFATEQALARAGFLNSSSLMVLQAFVFYLVCIRRYDDSKSVWAMGGLAIHQAYTQGMHRDPTHFGLPPFEVEMRRRLWWHITILDVRAAEDHGTELRTTNAANDTQFPANINDEDIWPGMKEPPTERSGATEMTFCLVRFELNAMTRKLGLFNDPNAQTLTDEVIFERESKIDQCHRQIEEKYLQFCNMNVPIQWVAATVGRLILAKMWLKIHHPRLVGQGLYEHPDIRERVFSTSVEVIEFGHLLERNENTARWAWLFRTYMQWHAVAYVLSELSVRPPGSEVDRAWRAVESVYEESEHAKKQRGMLWKPLRQLMARARAHQAKSMRGSIDASNMLEPGFIHGETSAVSNAAEALGLDFQEASLMNAVPNGQFLTPPGPNSATPEFLNWEGWSPGVGDFTVGAGEAQAFPFDSNQLPQEWF